MRGRLTTYYKTQPVTTTDNWEVRPLAEELPPVTATSDNSVLKLIELAGLDVTRWSGWYSGIPSIG